MNFNEATGCIYNGQFVIFIIYKRSLASSCNPFLNAVWKLYSVFFFPNKILPYLYALLAYPFLPSLNAQISPRALSSAGTTAHCREWHQAAVVLQQGKRVKWARTGWGRLNGTGQPTLAVLESRTQSPALTLGMTPSAGQPSSPVSTLGRTHWFCSPNSHTGAMWPLLDLQLRPGICRFVKTFDESGVNFPSFL